MIEGSQAHLGGRVSDFVLKFLDRFGLPHYHCPQGVTGLYNKWAKGELDSDDACRAARAQYRCKFRDLGGAAC
jgi:hypothetical protein